MYFSIEFSLTLKTDIKFLKYGDNKNKDVYKKEKCLVFLTIIESVQNDPHISFNIVCSLHVTTAHTEKISKTITSERIDRT